MGQVIVKDNSVDLGSMLAPAGARILECLKGIAPYCDHNIVITSGRDGEHSGPADPHHKGEAFDVRSKGLSPAQKSSLLNSIRLWLYKEPRRFYAFLEAPGTANEHIHIQRRAGTTYSMLDYLDNK